MPLPQFIGGQVPLACAVAADPSEATAGFYLRERGDGNWVVLIRFAGTRQNIRITGASLILLCQDWKKHGKARTVKLDTVILHSRADDVVPFADSEELAKNSGATLIEVRTDHRLADPEPLAAMLRVCEGAE